MPADASRTRALQPPDAKAWGARAAWFWRAHDANAGPHSLDLGPRAEALLHELETVFCAGAWGAVVILAWAIVEAEMRALERSRDAAADGPDIDWLRERRNRLAHVGPGEESSEALDERALEATAQGAVRIVFKTLFAGAWR
jgi:hypothetical protein